MDFGQGGKSGKPAIDYYHCQNVQKLHESQRFQKGDSKMWRTEKSNNLAWGGDLILVPSLMGKPEKRAKH